MRPETRLISYLRAQAVRLIADDRDRSYRYLKIANLITRILPITFRDSRRATRSDTAVHENSWDLFRKN